MEALIVFLLIILNGLFAMAEIAIISAKKHKLQRIANEGNANAAIALDLAKNPNRFLSTAQVGITLIGIFAGAFGGATIAKNLSNWLHHIPVLALYSDALGLGIVVILITYFSLIIGELVPKRIALSYPDKIALIVARPMQILSTMTTPVVTLLSSSTDAILRLFRIKQSNDSTVSEDEVRMLIKEGTEVGVFEQTEKNIVERTFRLSDRHVNSLMTSRKQIVWLEKDSSFQIIKNKITHHTHTHYPICKNNLDQIIGIVSTEDLLTHYLMEDKIDFQKSLHKPLFIPSNTPALRVLELFKKSGVHLAIIVDEYGTTEGILSLTDILEAIVGDIPSVNEPVELEITRRDKNSWLVDGLVAIDEFKDYFHIRKLPNERKGSFDTFGGFVMHQLGKIPVTGDKLVFDDFRIEVVDMDGKRVDKLLVTKKADQSILPL